MTPADARILEAARAYREALEDPAVDAEATTAAAQRFLDAAEGTDDSAPAPVAKDAVTDLDPEAWRRPDMWAPDFSQVGWLLTMPAAERDPTLSHLDACRAVVAAMRTLTGANFAVRDPRPV